MSSPRCRTRTERQRRRRRKAGISGVVTALLIGSGLALAAPVTATTPHPDGTQAIHWEPVHTVWDHGEEGLTSVTTNNGMVVAVWSDLKYQNAYIATRSAGQDWSTPQAVPAYAPVIALTKAGKGAWAVWQSGRGVTALQINADGSLGTPETIGRGTDPFIVELYVAAGAHGAVAAVWRTRLKKPAVIAYRPADGQWSEPESLPGLADVVGLVVGEAGTAQLVTAEGGYDHERLSYLRRSASGTWSKPFVVSSDASLPTVAGNADGDLVVGWEVVKGHRTSTLVARYKASDGAFGDAHHLNDAVPYGTYVAFGMAADGSLASAYRTTRNGSRQIQMTPADSAGLWLEPQTLSLAGGQYSVAMNSGGAFVVASTEGAGTQLVKCDAADVCGDAETNRNTGYRFATTSLGPNGAINLVWPHGCRGEACYPISIEAQRGH